MFFFVLFIIFIIILSIFLALCILHSLELLPKGIMLFLCNHLDWHIHNDNIGYDGCSFDSVCKYCKNPILQDGQGNWFRHRSIEKGEDK